MFLWAFYERLKKSKTVRKDNRTDMKVRVSDPVTTEE